MVHVVEMNGGVTAAQGFLASGVAARIKYAGRKDVALVFSKSPCVAAGIFTTNRVAAAPVLVDRERIPAHCAQGVLINSGCANACTGAQGLADARACSAAVAKAVGVDEERMLICSTGVIGALLPVDRMLTGIDAAAAALSREGGDDAAHAIMTTDTVDKQYAVSFELGGKRVTIGGMCKGSGMIEPNMATMLAVITTDAAVEGAWLQKALKAAADKSFNRVVVDGDESTNDSMILLANGAAGNAVISEDSAEAAVFLEALTLVAQHLAWKIVMDGEGVSKFVTVRVKGATSQEDAHRAARAIARSPLVKTSWFGIDPNWGRVICAAGYSGAVVDDTKARIFYGDVCAYDRGVVATGETLTKMKEIMKARSFDVTVDLGLGSGEEAIYTCDLTHRYIEINAEYTT